MKIRTFAYFCAGGSTPEISSMENRLRMRRITPPRPVEKWRRPSPYALGPTGRQVREGFPLAGRQMITLRPDREAHERCRQRQPAKYFELLPARMGQPQRMQRIEVGLESFQLRTDAFEHYVELAPALSDTVSDLNAPSALTPSRRPLSSRSDFRKPTLCLHDRAVQVFNF